MAKKKKPDPRDVRMAEKEKPLEEKVYLVTDQCFWKENPPENYNPLDKDRAEHAITLVDVDTGSITTLRSGSLISVVEAK